ncbi:MAG: bifunctional nuclease family protein [bacterium]
MVEVKVWKIAMDGRTDTPVVILREVNGQRILPIWIGLAEARAIAMELAGKKFERPLTHDLIKTIIFGLDAAVPKVVISEMKSNTFYAKIYLAKGDQVVGIDARPSDSIAVALRTKSPIYVAQDLLENQPLPVDATEEEEAEWLRRYLDELNPEDFGNYPL